MTENKENKMGTMPIGSLLINISLPIVISMLIQALYNIVDSYFVSKISENAFTAVSLAFPVQNLMISIAVGTGVGINALLSRSLGEKNFTLANKTAENGAFLAVLSALLMCVLGFFFTDFYFNAQTDIMEIVENGVIYTKICTVFSLFLFIEILCERLLQATGRTVYCMITQATGAIINIILDPILIFGMFGMPKMGVTGAAVATVIGQFSSAVIGIIFNLYFNHDIKIKIKGFKPNFHVIKTIYNIGLPAILMRSVSTVTVFGMNNLLLGFSSTATAVMGIYYKLESFAVMPVFGLNNGMVPIIAYNYGAKRKERIIKTIKISLIASFVIMGAAFLALLTQAEKILLMFNASSEMLEIGIPALRIISTHYIIACFSIILTAVFQAFGKGFYSLTMSVTRQLAVLLPVAFFLSKTGDLSKIWFAYPIAEIVAVILAVIFMTKVYKNNIKDL